MKIVKELWDQYYPEYQDASGEKSRDNDTRLKKEPEILNLILVRRRNEIQQEKTRHVEDLRRTTKQGKISTITILIIMM